MIDFLTFVLVKNIPATPATKCIYCARFDETNICYVGQAWNAKIRMNGHFQKLRSGKHHNRLLLETFNRIGCDRLTFYMLEKLPSNLSKPAMCSKEREWRKILFDQGYTLLNIG